MVTDPREPATILIGTVSILLTTNECLRMSEDIGITTAGKGVEDTTITEVDMDIAGNQTFESTTIDEFTLGHIWTVARSSSRHTGEGGFTVQIDIGAVIFIRAISPITLLDAILPICVFLTNGTLLTATEDLESIALVQVDGSAAPDFRRQTKATTEDVESRAEHIHTLLRKDDARITLRNLIGASLYVIIQGLSFI